MRALYQKLSQALEEIVTVHYRTAVEAPFWEIPKEKKFGDFSTMIALKLSRQLKQDPLRIALEVKELISHKFGKDISRVEIIKPGFVNIFISRENLVTALNRIVNEKKSFFQEKRSKKVLLEFVSANPTGPLSIAHGRQAIVGDVIARTLDFFGNHVTREYYVNDAGRQMELFIDSVKERLKELQGERFSIPDGGYQAEYVKDIARDAQRGNHEVTKEFVLSYMLSLIRRDLESLRIQFNVWSSQENFIRGGEVARALAFLEERGFAYEKDGALWFASTRFGDDKDRVLRKQDGELTYFASDIAYHKDKFERGFERFINLWGPDHHGYVRRVASAVQAMGFNEKTLEVLIIQLVSISTKERMSRRKGTAILLADLVKEVGPDAARFYYVLRRNSSQLEFDVDLAKAASFDNPLYYIQYAHARILSVFRKAGIKSFEPLPEAVFEEEDEDLIRHLLQLSYCLDKVYYGLEPVFLIEYLKDIAGRFHQYYERKRVLSDDAAVTASRLALLEAVRVVIATGLELLGIEPLQTM